MVGIAGEDDLDAPPDVTSDRTEVQHTVEAVLASSPHPAPAPISASPFRNGNPRISPVGEKLNAEESAAIRAQLILEIESFPEDDLQPRAIAILKAKNRLSADDAKLVEEAFAARMALQGVSSEALATEEPASAPTDPSQPQPPVASTDAVKRPRGRPRKVKAPIDATEPSLKPSPRQPQLWRRGHLVGETGYRSRRDFAYALGFDAAHRMKARA
jgi:hypothetical protein